MRRHLLAAWALAVLALLAAAPAAGARAPRTIPFGFTDATSPERLQRVRGLGATVGRFFVCWCDLEPEPGRYDLAFFDRVVAGFRAHDVRPFMTVVGTPGWARAECAALPRPCLYPPQEVHLPRWRALFEMLARRYPALLGIEVWNEPNLAHFWRPRADARRYVRLLRAAHAGARAGNPKLPVVAGALCLCGGGEGGINDFTFLDRMYRAGARGSFDAIGVHNYPTDLPVIANARDKLAQMRRVRDRHRDRGRAFWVTEAGISTARGGADRHPRLSEPLQARALAALLRTFRAARDVRVAIFFRYRDVRESPNPWEHGLGIGERADGSAKPAGAALAAALRDLRPYRRPGRVRMSASPRRVEAGRPVRLRVRGWARRARSGRRVFAWDVGGGGFYAYTRGPTRLRVWRRPGRYRVAVRAGDELDAGEGVTTVVVIPRRRR